MLKVFCIQIPIPRDAVQIQRQLEPSIVDDAGIERVSLRGGREGVVALKVNGGVEWCSEVLDGHIQSVHVHARGIAAVSDL